MQSNWTCASSDQAARGFQRVNVIEDPSTLKECKIISADISNMYPSLPIAMMIQVSHVVIDEAFRRAALTLGLKMKYEHIREINAMPLQPKSGCKKFGLQETQTSRRQATKKFTV